jgi:hypothetical protein
MPWVAGQSGNPVGRPPDKYSIRSILKRIGNQTVETSVGKMRKAELMWTAIYNEAIKGDVKAAIAIADRLEGKPNQSIEILTNRIKESALTDTEKAYLATQLEQYDEKKKRDDNTDPVAALQ